MLKLALIPYFTMFKQTIYEFPVKKEPGRPPWGRSLAQGACSQAARSAIFATKFKISANPISSETIILTYTGTFTRLILILKGAHDYEAMGS